MAFELVWLAAAGALGQLVRMSYGLAGAMKEKEPIDKNRIIGSLFGALCMGAMAGLVLTKDPTQAFLLGFAGVDVLEGVGKLIKK